MYNITITNQGKGLLGVGLGYSVKLLALVGLSSCRTKKASTLPLELITVVTQQKKIRERAVKK